jgi:hypothetical protein
MRAKATEEPSRVGRSETGLGLFAADVIEKGTFIIEYVGPRIPNEEVHGRRSSRYLLAASACPAGRNDQGVERHQVFDHEHRKQEMDSALGIDPILLPSSGASFLRGPTISPARRMKAPLPALVARELTCSRPTPGWPMMTKLAWCHYRRWSKRICLQCERRL